MILSAALMMMLAAPSADAVGSTRRAFSECLQGQVQPAIDKKLSLGDFQATLKTACEAQERVFRSAILAADKADGLPAKAAQTDADEQVTDYLDKITREFEDYRQPG